MFLSEFLGNFGLKPDAMAGIILDAIGEFCLSTTSTKLKLVRIVVFNKPMIKHLLTEMKRLTQDGIEQKSWYNVVKGR